MFRFLLKAAALSIALLLLWSCGSRNTGESSPSDVENAKSDSSHHRAQVRAMPKASTPEQRRGARVANENIAAAQATIEGRVFLPNQSPATSATVTAYKL